MLAYGQCMPGLKWNNDQKNCRNKLEKQTRDQKVWKQVEDGTEQLLQNGS